MNSYAQVDINKLQKIYESNLGDEKLNTVIDKICNFN